MKKNNLTGPWTLAGLAAGSVGLPKSTLKVFSCFHCGGGSSMGYKLAGLDVIGGVEVDPKMMALYHANVLKGDKKLSFLMPIQDFVRCEMENLPKEMYDLDVLDGSPPCSSFSRAGSREKGWGKKKKFREGQVDQVLDDLFFHFIAVAKRLRPKMVVAENVKGLIEGQARGYVRMIFEAFKEAGYDVQLFLLNSAKMGVPQARERTFFVARRTDIGLPKLELNFDDPVITAKEATEGCRTDGKPITEGTQQLRLWKRCLPGDSFSKHHQKGLCFTSSRLNGNAPAPTVTSQITGHNFHWSEPRNFTAHEIVRLQSFPEDYDFLDQEAGYVCGMSVPPYMMARVADAVARTLSSRGSVDQSVGPAGPSTGPGSPKQRGTKGRAVLRVAASHGRAHGSS